ncbi:fimbrial protein [Serratia sp. 2723]|uniref:fimbrial protein n=1 Tax=unclassified Serratia (in: enterobacteria) TaxID=2647522 RepID=UPI003D1DAE64
MNRVNLIVLAMIAMSGSAKLMAECNSTISQVPLASISDVQAQRDAPVGALLYSGMMSTSVNVSENTGGGFYIQAREPAYGVNALVYNGLRVFNTNINGVGIAFDAMSGGDGIDVDFRDGKFTGTIDKNTAYYLVKTGAISTGKLEGQLLKLYYVCLGASNGISYNNNIAINGGSMSVLACAVTNTAINVPLGDVHKSEFSGVGSSSTKKSFNIPLNCDGNTRINITIDAEPDSSKTPGVIAINASTPGSVANGVGILIQHKNTAVTLGKPLQVGTALNSGVYNIPLEASYYQTQNTITGGQANGTANFTVTYN